MFGSNPELLVRGAAAARANDRQEARFYLEWVLRTDAGIEQRTEAWYWLSHIADNPTEKRRCLENVLAAYPGHPEARRDLALLEGRLKREDLVDHRRPVTPLAPSPQLGPQEVQRYRCPECGGALGFNPTKGALSCQFCGYHKVEQAEVEGGAGPRAGARPGGVEEQDWVAAIHTAQGHRWELPMERVFTCQGCGATQTVPPAQTSMECPFCGSPQVVQAGGSRDLIGPEGVVPFGFDGVAARERARRWLGEQRFRPNDLAQQAAISSPRPVYLPFWTFDIGGEVRWSGFVEERSVRVAKRGGETIFHNDLLVPASTSLPEQLLAALRFDTTALVPYSPDLLVDWPAEIYRLPLADASLRAREQILPSAKATVLHTAGQDVRDLTVNTVGMSVISYKLVLLPVWATSYRYQGQRHQLAINGQTGQVHGQVPRSKFQQFLTNLNAGW